MKIDRDLIPIALITACIVIWLSSKPWAHTDAIQIAGDIVKVSFGGVLGYMVKSALDAIDVDKVMEENQRLKRQLLNVNSYESPTQSAEYIEGP